jgi:hypothetical protein
MKTKTTQTTIEVVLTGKQEGFGSVPAFWLYTVKSTSRPLLNVEVGSTLSEKTLKQLASDYGAFVVPTNLATFIALLGEDAELMESSAENVGWN